MDYTGTLETIQLKPNGVIMSDSNWFKKHADTVVILAAFASSFLWMNGKFNDLDKELGILKTEVAVMKTVMLMKNILPAELAKGESHD